MTTQNSSLSRTEQKQKKKKKKKTETEQTSRDELQQKYQLRTINSWAA